jgi:hypothetical protein
MLRVPGIETIHGFCAIFRDECGDGKRAVATPIGTALSRHDALRVPFGFASLQKSPPPVLLTSDTMQVYDAR